MIDCDVLKLSAATCEQFIVPSYAADEETHNLFMDAFIENNRLDGVSQVMGYHPDYLRIFMSTQHFLLREDGPLSHDYRQYIAIMAAARHHCTYLVEVHEQDFLFHGGDPEWLKGLDHAPRKLRDLYEINKLLAHQPWLITKEHMLKLLKSSEPWSLSELMHAIILLTHFHALCSFVFGCGISAEVDSQGGHTYVESVLTSTAPTSLSTCSSYTSTSPSDAITTTSSTTATTNTTGAASNGRSDVNSNGNCQVNGVESNVCVKALMEKMRQMQEAPSELKSAAERIKQFNMEGKNTAEIAVPNSKQSASKSEIVNKYLQDGDFAYTDFHTRTCTEVQTFCACDYSWEDHGFSLANRLYADIGHYLDDKYSTAANMTYYTMGDLREVDTSSFRRAIWNYIHIMYGICHDDYDYSELNQLLEIKLKAYIKTLTCYPERLKKKDFDGVMKGFQHSEKVHVNLMVMEARQQAELLYALRALNCYLT
ncbi:sestrin-1 [Elysia marginata]|uniref:Sestrin-1 n=1 Tax=Elysia marginata TaxID=1093978 RepID=A0AAV4JIY6_9GAST|nr:sestrin-1 [Elysia marginata]